MSISQSEHDSVPHKSSVAVVVDTEDSRLVQEAYSLREKLKKQNNPLDYIVCFGSHGVDIRSALDRGKKGQMVDFSTIDRRTGAGNLSKKQPFPKAIGSTTKTIIDATAGFGTDSAMLACMGYSVVAIERCPIISVLLRDGLFRALQNKDLCVALKDTLSFVEADSTIELSRRKGVDVVYLEPMFPPKRKKNLHLFLRHYLQFHQAVEADARQSTEPALSVGFLYFFDSKSGFVLSLFQQHLSKCESRTIEATFAS